MLWTVVCRIGVCEYLGYCFVQGGRMTQDLMCMHTNRGARWHEAAAAVILLQPSPSQSAVTASARLVFPTPNIYNLYHFWIS